jgi:hypothetical protein
VANHGINLKGVEIGKHISIVLGKNINISVNGY